MSKIANKWFFRRILIVLAIIFLCSHITFCQEAETEYGELEIDCNNITSLMLGREDGKNENMSNPGKLNKLPVGKYFVRNAVIADEYQYSSNSNPKLSKNSDWIVITKDKPAILKIGTPFKQRIDVEKRGNYLILNYNILGVGGLKYNKIKNREKRPEFLVYKGDKLIASDKFQYG